MKYLIIFLFLLTLYSCNDSEYNINRNKAILHFRNNVNNYNKIGKIKKSIEFSYKGHDYIEFSGYKYNFSVIHSPECRKCNKQFKNLKL